MKYCGGDRARADLKNKCLRAWKRSRCLFAVNPAHPGSNKGQMASDCRHYPLLTVTTEYLSFPLNPRICRPCRLTVVKPRTSSKKNATGKNGWCTLTIAAVTSSSLFASNAAVGSSSRSMGLGLKNALAMAMRCFWPTLSPDPAALKPENE